MSVEIVEALITQLVRRGALDADDIAAICEGLSDDDAHQVRCSLIEADAPSDADWAAGKARSKFRIVE